MKTSLFIITLLFATLTFQAQSCLPSGIHFATQKNVDDFPINYPGCTEILGNVLISSGVTNLLALSQLQTIHGDLSIAPSTRLINLQGLNNLTTIGGSFLIDRAVRMDFKGMDKLASIGKKFEISKCDQLVNLNEMKQLTTIHGDLIIRDNKFVEFGGLDYLTSLKKGLQISKNQFLTNINGLSKVSIIEGGMAITENPALIRPNGLNNLERINGYVEIRQNQSLIDFVGLENLKQFSNRVGIDRNPALINFQGLNGLEKIVGGLTVSGNDNLLNFSGLDNLHTIGTVPGDWLFVSNNDKLVNFEGLVKINTIAGFKLGANKVLKNLQGLNTLTTISQRGLDIIGTQLKNFEGLDNLTTIKLEFSVISNDFLIDFSGLHSLKDIGYLTVRYNKSLVNFNGLSKLTSTGHMYIDSNEMLKNFTGLETLNSLKNENITIGNSIRLRSLNGLQNIDPNTIGNLGINELMVLSECAFPNICTYLYNGGKNSISGNAPGCKDKEDILNHCEPLGMAEEITSGMKAIVFPNPTRDSFRIRTTSKIEKIQIFSTLGNKVKEFTDTEIYNIEELGSGVYIILVETDEGKMFSKLLKS